MDAQALATVVEDMEAGVARTMEDMAAMVDFTVVGVGHARRSTMAALSMLRPPLEDTRVDLMVDMDT